MPPCGMKCCPYASAHENVSLMVGKGVFVVMEQAPGEVEVLCMLHALASERRGHAGRQTRELQKLKVRVPAEEVHGFIARWTEFVYAERERLRRRSS